MQLSSWEKKAYKRPHLKRVWTHNPSNSFSWFWLPREDVKTQKLVVSVQSHFDTTQASKLYNKNFDHFKMVCVNKKYILGE